MSSDSLRITGGRPLRGSILVRGAKNTIPKNMVASLLTDEPCQVHNISDIVDVDLCEELLLAMGAQVVRNEHSVAIDAAAATPLSRQEIVSFSRRSRIPVLLSGPYLHRFGEALVAAPGGCVIGSRPIDFHVHALEALGAERSDEPEGIVLRASRLRGAKIRLDYPSVGATEQVLLAAVMADGVTEVSNAAIEPEVIDLIGLLQKMGAIISLGPDRVIQIQGVDSLHGFIHTAMPDRLEVASWACAAIATNGHVFVRNARQIDMMTFLNVYRRIGGEFDIRDDGILFRRASNHLTAIPLETDVHPGFMTDWQQPLVVALTQAVGVSIVHETVYEDRFGYVDALTRMGATIQLHQECLGSSSCRFGQRNLFHSAVVSGPSHLRGCDITVPDLRGGFSYVVAALVAEGESTVHNIDLIRRGYEDFLPRLQELGAEAEFLSQDEARAVRHVSAIR